MPFTLKEEIPITGLPGSSAIFGHTIISSPDGGYFISDEFNHRIVKVSADGKCLDVIGKRGNGDGEFWYPRGLAITQSSTGPLLAVSDSWNHRIQLFSLDCQFKSLFGSIGKDKDLFYEPEIILPAEEGFMWILDSGNHRVKKCSLSGDTVSMFGSKMKFSEEKKFVDLPDLFFKSSVFDKREFGFLYPKGIASTSKNDFIVADTNNCRLYIINNDLINMTRISFNSTGKPPFSYPDAVHVTKNGYIIVSFVGAQKLQIINHSPPYKSYTCQLPTFKSSYRIPLLIEDDSTIVSVEPEAPLIKRYDFSPDIKSLSVASIGADFEEHYEHWYDYFIDSGEDHKTIELYKAYIKLLEQKFIEKSAEISILEKNYCKSIVEYYAVLTKLEEAKSQGKSIQNEHSLLMLKLNTLLKFRKDEDLYINTRYALVGAACRIAFSMGHLSRETKDNHLKDEEGKILLILNDTFDHYIKDFNDTLEWLREYLGEPKSVDIYKSITACAWLIILFKHVRYLKVAISVIKNGMDGIEDDEPKDFPTVLYPFCHDGASLSENIYLVLSEMCINWEMFDSARIFLDYGSKVALAGDKQYRLLYAKLFRSTGNFEEAMNQIGSVDGFIGFQKAEILLEKGLTLLAQNNAKGALEAFTEAEFDLDENLFYPLFHKADALERLGRLEEALELYDSALDNSSNRLLPNSFDQSAIARARTLYQLGRFEEAATYIDSLPLLEDGQFIVYIRAGIFQFLEEGNKAALEGLKNLVDENPDYEWIRPCYAVRLAMAGNFSEAIKEINFEKTNFPKPSVIECEGLCLRISGRFEEAINIFRSGGKDIFNYPPSLIEMAITAFALESTKEADDIMAAYTKIMDNCEILHGFIIVPENQKELVEKALAILHDRLATKNLVLATSQVNNSTLSYKITQYG